MWAFEQDCSNATNFGAIAWAPEQDCSNTTKTHVFDTTFYEITYFLVIFGELLSRIVGPRGLEAHFGQFAIEQVHSFGPFLGLEA